MVERGRGGLIFVASTAGYRSIPYFGVYSATKAFNLFLGEALWGEYSGSGIDVLALSPGPTKTEFQATTNPGKRPNYPMARADKVVRLAIRKLGNKPSIIHGIINRLIVGLQRITPKKLLLSVTGKVIRTRL